MTPKELYKKEFGDAENVSKEKVIELLSHFAEALRRNKDHYMRTTEDRRELLDEAASLVGNPGTNISGSCDVACMEWHKKYDKFVNDKF